jgi:hypothetical protein
VAGSSLIITGLVLALFASGVASWVLPPGVVLMLILVL